MADYETLLYNEVDGVAWVTMNRPDVHNAFNFKMQEELKDVWQSLRSNDDVRCAVLCPHPIRSGIGPGEAGYVRAVC
jgi:enoyl-CoA hydratase/carnithine racemase